MVGTDMTDKLIEQIKADSEAGTEGPWRLGSWLDNVFGTGPKDEWLPVCRIKRDDAPVDESRDCIDARRIARVPDMEARILADAKIIKALIGALGDIFDGEPEWPDDFRRELFWCRERAGSALSDYRAAVSEAKQ